MVKDGGGQAVLWDILSRIFRELVNAPYRGQLLFLPSQCPLLLFVESIQLLLLEPPLNPHYLGEADITTTPGLRTEPTIWSMKACWSQQRETQFWE